MRGDGVPPAGGTLIVAFLLMLLFMVVVTMIGNGCDNYRKNIYKEGYDKGHYDGYWKAKAEHGVF